MSTSTILLDTGPLGLVTHPGAGEYARRCTAWLDRMRAEGARIVVPAIADYELRRELLRAGEEAGAKRLDELIARSEYLPIDAPTLADAARVWADARRDGRATEPDAALDADCILAAQAMAAPRILALEERSEVVIATANAKQLEPYAKARHWSEVEAFGQRTPESRWAHAVERAGSVRVSDLSRGRGANAIGVLLDSGLEADVVAKGLPECRLHAVQAEAGGRELSGDELLAVALRAKCNVVMTANLTAELEAARVVPPGRPKPLVSFLILEGAASSDTESIHRSLPEVRGMVSDIVGDLARARHQVQPSIVP